MSTGAMIGALCQCEKRRCTHVVTSSVPGIKTHRCAECAAEMQKLGWVVYPAILTERPPEPESP